MKDFSFHPNPCIEGDEHCSLKTEKWFTSKEAAEYLGISEATLRNMTSNGRVPYYKLGRRNRYLAEELRMLIFSNRRRGIHGN